MKKQYTEMITAIRQAHKRSGLSYDALHDLSVKRRAGNTGAKDSLAQVLNEMEYVYETSDKAAHIFMPGRPFCDWLSGCAQTLDAELGERAAEGLGSPFVCLHFPCESGLESVLVGLGTGERRGMLLLSASCASPHGPFYMKTTLRGQSKDANMTPSGDSDFTPELSGRLGVGDYYTRLIAGLGLYMSAFPEQVRDGIPEDAKRVGRISGPSRTVGVAESVVVRDGLTPHYRSGHFRLLSAERYVNKRGQVVFIHGCFVRGQARTVLSTEAAPA